MAPNRSLHLFRLFSDLRKRKYRHDVSTFFSEAAETAKGWRRLLKGWRLDAMKRLYVYQCLSLQVAPPKLWRNTTWALQNSSARTDVSLPSLGEVKFRKFCWPSTKAPHSPRRIVEGLRAQKCERGTGLLRECNRQQSTCSDVRMYNQRKCLYTYSNGQCRRMSGNNGTMPLHL